MTDADFASGKIPTPDGTTNTSYFNVTDTSGTGSKACTTLTGNSSIACNTPAADCYCQFSTQGTIPAGSSPLTGDSYNLGLGGSAPSTCDPNNTLSNGLAGYWKMNETAWNSTPGEIIDYSGNGNNGRAYGGAVPASGKFGNSGRYSQNLY